MLSLEQANRPRLLTQRFDLSIRISHEADPRAALTHLVGRPLGLDRVRPGQRREGAVEIVHADRDVTVGSAELVASTIVVEVSSRTFSWPPIEKK